METGGTGVKKSEGHKRRNSESHVGLMAGEKNPMFGVHRFGESSPMFGKRIPEEAKKKLSAFRKLWWEKKRSKTDDKVFTRASGPL